MSSTVRRPNSLASAFKHLRPKRTHDSRVTWHLFNKVSLRIQPRDSFAKVKPEILFSYMVSLISRQPFKIFESLEEET